MHTTNDNHNPPYIGQLFRQERIKKNLTLEDAAKRLSVARAQIEALEEGNLNFFPALVYARGLTKKYAEFLGFDADASAKEIELAWQRICGSNESAQKEKQRGARFIIEKIYKQYFIGSKTFLWSVIACFIALAVYLAINAFQRMQKPDFTFSYPEGDVISTTPVLTIRGNASENVELTLSGQPVYIDSNGAFSRTLILQKGINILTLEGKNSFGKTATIERRVVVLE